MPGGPSGEVHKAKLNTGVSKILKRRTNMIDFDHIDEYSER